MSNLRALPDNLILSTGSHEPDGQMCVMEAVAYVAGEPWSDHPACASLTIASFCRTWNDTNSLDGASIRRRLLSYVPRLAMSAGTDDQELARSFLALDWLIRTYLPAWLDLDHLATHAAILRRLPPQSCSTALIASYPARASAGAATEDVAVDVARAATRAAARAATQAAAGTAAWDAARAATGAAAWDTARDTAWGAARAATGAAVRAATRVAARATAGDAAWDVAWDAAGAALRSTVHELQTSAWALLDRLFTITEDN